MIVSVVQMIKERIYFCSTFLGYRLLFLVAMARHSIILLPWVVAAIEGTLLVGVVLLTEAPACLS
jgi:hypothetical protein